MTIVTGGKQYVGYGLGIQSEFDLPELRNMDGRAIDLTISRGRVDRPDPPQPYGRIHAFDADETYIGIESVGKFLLKGSKEVVCQMSPLFPDGLAGFALLGPIMATIMHLRGNLILHGSALEVGGKAVVFLGDKGAGKSTMAGAMATAGHALITDDVIAVGVDGAHAPTVVSAYPTIKLSDAAIESFGAEGFELLPLDADIPSKQRARVSAAPQRERTPIGRIYILSRGAADAPASVETLPLDKALPQLFAHSYMARYGADPFKHDNGMARHMRQCAALMDKAPVKLLTVPGALGRLGEAVAIVAEDSASG